MDQSKLSLSGALLKAQAGKTAMAASVMHLFKAGFNPTPTNLLADFTAQECDYDGYTSKAIATWSDPILAGVGYAIYAPTQTFVWTLDTDAVGNQVGGHYLVNAGGALVDFAIYDPSIPMQGPFQAVVKTPVQTYPAG